MIKTFSWSVISTWSCASRRCSPAFSCPIKLVIFALYEPTNVLIKVTRESCIVNRCKLYYSPIKVCIVAVSVCCCCCCDCSQPSLRAVKIRAVFGHWRQCVQLVWSYSLTQVYRKFSGFIARLAYFSVPFAAPKARQGNLCSFSFTLSLASFVLYCISDLISSHFMSLARVFASVHSCCYCILF